MNNICKFKKIKSIIQHLKFLKIIKIFIFIFKFEFIIKRLILKTKIVGIVKKLCNKCIYTKIKKPCKFVNTLKILNLMSNML